MLFSEHYNIKYNKDNDEWFNPILTQDTLLFIDPFAVFKSKDDLFKDTYSEMMDFFQQAFELIAQVGGNENSLIYKKAINMLMFPEDNAFCLGYSKTRRGSGTGPQWAKTLTHNINNIIKKGISHLSHFEELGIFCTGVGPDRLSDMTTNLLKTKFIKYTQRICNSYGIPMQIVRVKNAYFDYEFKKWNSGEYLLPINPYKNNSPIILVPKNFLNMLPEINSNDFDSTINLSETLRNDFNYEVGKNLKKEKIAEIALEHYELVEKYINIVEKRKSCQFDELTKKTLRYDWYNLSKEITAINNFNFGCINSDDEFFNKILQFANYYKNFIELNSGYKLLWNEDSPRSEEDVQILFKGILDEHCRANNIDFNREVNQGRGPVDFKFSLGYSNRVLIEAKLAKNTHFWNGLKKQLPKYMQIDSCNFGIFLVIVYTDKDLKRISDIQNITSETAREYNITLKTVIVDARKNNKVSASKL